MLNCNGSINMSIILFTWRVQTGCYKYDTILSKEYETNVRNGNSIYLYFTTLFLFVN